MLPVIHRLFWLFVLLLQIGSLVTQMTGINTGRGTGPAATYSLVFQLAFCVPLVVLVLQKPILSHNFWAGCYGISVAALLASALSAFGTAHVAPTSPATAMLIALSMLQLVCIFGQFILVYGSPQLWQRSLPPSRERNLL